MRKVLIPLLLGVISTDCLAQGSGGVDVSIRNLEYRQMTFMAAKRGHGFYTVAINVTGVENYNIARLVVDTVSVSRDLFTLSPINGLAEGSVNFLAYHALGMPQDDQGHATTFALPVAAGRRDLFCGIVDTPQGPMARFQMNQTDIVAAIEAGEVITVQVADSGDAAGSCSVTVLHTGGTWAYYANLSAASVALKPGDRVARGEKFGEVDRNTPFGSNLFIYVNHPVLVDDSQQAGIKRFEYRSLNPFWATDAGRVRLTLPEEVHSSK